MKNMGKEGYFNLGNRKLEIIELPGHTPGIVGLLDEKTGALLCGDAITSTGLLLGLPERLSLSTQLETVDKIQELVDSGKVKTLYSGHGAFEMDTNIINKFKTALSKIKSLDLTDEEKETGTINYEGLIITFKLDNLD
jgi:Zn-dependent hydrolases, including glyoxylases